MYICKLFLEQDKEHILLCSYLFIVLLSSFVFIFCIPFPSTLFEVGALKHPLFSNIIYNAFVQCFYFPGKKKCRSLTEQLTQEWHG